MRKQTLSNWLRLAEKGELQGAGDWPVSAEQVKLARLRADLARVKMERDILKMRQRRKPRVLSPDKDVKCAWIAKNSSVRPVTMPCEVLDVSTSSYFEHQRQCRTSQPSRPGGGRLGNDALLAHIRAIHAEVKGEYGWPGVWKELLARGIRVGEDRVQRLMQARGIKARSKRKFVVATGERWLYLAVVVVLFSRMVVGWSTQPHMQASLVTDALRMAWSRRRPAPGLTFRSEAAADTAIPRCRMCWPATASSAR